APAEDADGVQAARVSACGGKGWFDACNPECCKPARAARVKPVIAEYTGDDAERIAPAEDA
ncbi:hypothetical protein SA13R_09190, partial [Rothia kristinae]